MNIDEFKQLTLSKQLQLANEWMAALRDANKRTADFDDFFDHTFNYRQLYKVLYKAGYSLHRKSKQFVRAYDQGLPEPVEPAEPEVRDMPELTYEEISALKGLLEKQSTGAIQDTIDSYISPTSEYKATTVRIEQSVFDQWTELAKQYPYYNSADLISAALLEFAQRYKK